MLYTHGHLRLCSRRQLVCSLRQEWECSTAVQCGSFPEVNEPGSILCGLLLRPCWLCDYVCVPLGFFFFIFPYLSMERRLSSPLQELVGVKRSSLTTVGCKERLSGEPSPSVVKLWILFFEMVQVPDMSVRSRRDWTNSRRDTISGLENTYCCLGRLPLATAGGGSLLRC